METFGIDTGELALWRALMAVARIAEGFEAAGLLEVWRQWRASTAVRPPAQPDGSIASRRASNTPGEATATSPSFSGHGSSTAAPASPATIAPAE